MAGESQAGASSLAAVRLTGANAEATEDDQDRADALADGPDDKRRVELYFVHDVTTDGQAFRCLTVKDDHTRRCLAIEEARSFTQNAWHERVIEVLTRLIFHYGCPQYMRSDNGPEFIVVALLKFLEGQGIQPSRMTPGKPWQNGGHESFNGRFRRECLDAERFHCLTEARVVIEDWLQLITSGLAVRWATRRLGRPYEGGARQKTAAGDFAHVAGEHSS